MDFTSIIGKLRTFAFRCLLDKKKEEFFVSNYYWGWKMDLFWQS